MSIPDLPDPEPGEDARAPQRGGPSGRLLRPVVLVGLMGAGKTSVGRRLASALGAPFVDSDEEVERAARMSVAEIFETMGEPAFRDGERRVIARLLERRPGVIATGGGAWMNDATREAIRARGALVCWLRAELSTLMERVGRKGGRPLLAGADPEGVLARLMETRHPVYALADLVVDSHAGERHEVVVARLLDGLRDQGALEAPAAPPPSAISDDMDPDRGEGA